MKVEVDETKLVEEIEKLMKHHAKTLFWFSKDFPELYWKVYIPCKTKRGGENEV